MKLEGFYDLYCEEVLKNEQLIAENRRLKALNLSLSRRITYLETHQEEIIEKQVKKQLSQVTNQFEKKVLHLQNQVEQLKSVLNHDSSNSGIPTSKTAIDHEKRIPNFREKTEKTKGGQPHHPKHKLEAFWDEEVTDFQDHQIEICSQCGHKMDSVGAVTIKDEVEFKVVVKKIRHRFNETKCPVCHHREKVTIPASLKEENQYGTGVQALALTMLNEGFVSMKRTKEIVSGLTAGEINLSEGYIAKLQKRLYCCLSEFQKELRKQIISLSLVHWDDTVIAIDKHRACLRFYGDREWAYYAAHEKKDKIGLDEDKILQCLDDKTVVVHDHNKVNYNEDYVFLNAECCTHLLRDLKKIVDTLQHEWPKSMINLLIGENVKRMKGEWIDSEYIDIQYEQIVAEGWIENWEVKGKYGESDEATLLKRLQEYKENYLMWTLNSEIPFSNNLAERALRGSKTKMKVSGQFANIQNAEYFAVIKSYIETGHRHGMNSTLLITRALTGNPVMIEEMKKYDRNADF